MKKLLLCITVALITTGIHHVVQPTGAMERPKPVYGQPLNSLTNKATVVVELEKFCNENKRFFPETLEVFRTYHEQSRHALVGDLYQSIDAPIQNLIKALNQDKLVIELTSTVAAQVNGYIKTLESLRHSPTLSDGSGTTLESNSKSSDGGLPNISGIDFKSRESAATANGYEEEKRFPSVTQRRRRDGGTIVDGQLENDRRPPSAHRRLIQARQAGTLLHGSDHQPDRLFDTRETPRTRSRGVLKRFDDLKLADFENDEHKSDDETVDLRNVEQKTAVNTAGSTAIRHSTPRRLHPIPLPSGAQIGRTSNAHHLDQSLRSGMPADTGNRLPQHMSPQRPSSDAPDRRSRSSHRRTEHPTNSNTQRGRF